MLRTCMISPFGCTAGEVLGHQFGPDGYARDREFHLLRTECGPEANLDLHQFGDRATMAFALAAIDWNVTWSMPGILAVTVRSNT